MKTYNLRLSTTLVDFPAENIKRFCFCTYSYPFQSEAEAMAKVEKLLAKNKAVRLEPTKHRLEPGYSATMCRTLAGALPR